MGLYVHSLLELPIEAKRSYYIYLLDYGWAEPLSGALFENFHKMAEIASNNDAIVIRGFNSPVHFSDEVFSWHSINGEDGREFLPAILVTDKHPREFRESFDGKSLSEGNRTDFKIIVFPLKKYCKTTTDVAAYIDKIFRDIVEKKNLSDFRVLKEMKKGLGKAVVDGLLLQPNVAGLGYDLKPLIQYFTSR